ncbi:hypothetical protein OXX59_009885 [Metschnikowia pulcherrima]
MLHSDSCVVDFRVYGVGGRLRVEELTSRDLAIAKNLGSETAKIQFLVLQEGGNREGCSGEGGQANGWRSEKPGRGGAVAGPMSLNYSIVSQFKSTRDPYGFTVSITVNENQIEQEARTVIVRHSPDRNELRSWHEFFDSKAADLRS